MTDTLKSTYEQCSHLSAPNLDFISNKRLKEIIARDLNELGSAAIGEHEKTVTILCGAIFEAVLHGFLDAQQSYIKARRGSFTLSSEPGLKKYLKVFNRWFLDDLPNARIPDFVVGYRNLVHIDCELDLPIDICTRGSREMLVALDNILGALSKFVIP